MSMSKGFMLVLTSLLFTLAYAGNSIAGVYVCIDKPCIYAATITEDEKSTKPTNGVNISVDDALKNSSNLAIQDGYNSKNITNLLKKGYGIRTSTKYSI